MHTDSSTHYIYRKLISRLEQGAKNILGGALKVHGIVLPLAFLLCTLAGCLT